MNGSSHNGDDSGRDREDPKVGLSERRDRLNQTLADRAAAEQRANAGLKSEKSGYGLAVKHSSEFIAGIVTGGGIGWLLDQWLGTSPFGLIVFLLLGFAAGVLNILRSAGYVAEPEASLDRKRPDDDGSKS
ncbi:ATP synthase protein I [Roseibium aquae]|uniref:ATP synthase protein I n=1 Tax=Roseibium aquae TaxID=1323746 RepID=A0A916TKG0_9HYPH|nr:AtpZ/AtpI family protein [Roseibium aquae]GGB52047.1 ATP synthase protein I [Roseibium aquae]